LDQIWAVEIKLTYLERLCASTLLVQAWTTKINPSVPFQPDQSGASDLDPVDAERSQYLKPVPLILYPTTMIGYQLAVGPSIICAEGC
jgi:hypothetical protein